MNALKASVKSYAQDGVTYNITVCRDGDEVTIYTDIIKIDGKLPNHGWGSGKVTVIAYGAETSDTD